MLTISDLANDRSTVTVKYRGREVNVTYRPSVFTMDYEKEMVGKPIVDLIPMWLESWEVVDAEGAPSPITAETLRSLPAAFVLAVYEAVTDDARSGGLGEAPAKSPTG